MGTVIFPILQIRKIIDLSELYQSKVTHIKGDRVRIKSISFDFVSTLIFTTTVACSFIPRRENGINWTKSGFETTSQVKSLLLMETIAWTPIAFLHLQTLPCPQLHHYSLECSCSAKDFKQEGCTTIHA